MRKSFNHKPYKPYDYALDTYAYFAIIFSLIVALIYIIATNVFNFDINKYILPCRMHMLTGYYCPGCGGTRAFKYLLTGNIIKSIYYHPFVAYIILPAIIFFITQSEYRIRIIISKKNTNNNPYISTILPTLTITPLYIYIGVSVLIAQFVLKNLIKLLFGYSLI